jgi:hypothetical protein
MLDPNDPELEKLFAVSGCEGALVWLAKRMTLVDTERKRGLMQEADAALSNMRALSAEHWPGDEAKIGAIEAFEAGLRRLADLPSNNDYLIHWHNKRCTVCRGRIQDPPRQPDMVYCPTCLQTIDEGRRRIAEAFYVGYEDQFAS